MKDIKGTIGYFLGWISIIWILCNCMKSLRDISTSLMFILGSSIQPAILLIIGLLALKFSNKSNFMNEPENIKKWYIITTVSIYVCIFCSFSSISYIYIIPLGGPKIIHSLVCFLISALLITILIYLKSSMGSRFLRWGVSIFSILFLCYGIFLSFVFIYALPDKSSQPAFGAFVSASSVALIIFQLIWYRKKNELKSSPC